MPHSLEGLIFLLVIGFYILRGIYRAIRSVFMALRKAFGNSAAAEEARRAASQQMRQGPPPQVTARPPQPRPATTRARRPEAGGPAVTDTATSGQFRTQVAQIEAQESPGLAASQPATVTTDETPPLFRGGDDLVRAVIFQEILGKPLSQRGRGMSYKDHTPGPQQ